MTRSPSPEQVRKDRKRRKSHKQRPDKENREELRDAVFTRKREDGSTSLAILNPGEGVIPGTERDRPVSLGNYLGKVMKFNNQCSCVIIFCSVESKTWSKNLF